MSEALSIGAPLLLPPLRERMELLHSLLPQGPDCWNTLSRGQVSQGYIERLGVVGGIASGGNRPLGRESINTTI